MWSFDLEIMNVDQIKRVVGMNVIARQFDDL